jgi:hypothetical protein
MVGDGQEIPSNITDNESAKIKGPHGVIIEVLIPDQRFRKRDGRFDGRKERYNSKGRLDAGQFKYNKKTIPTHALLGKDWFTKVM